MGYDNNKQNTTISNKMDIKSKEIYNIQKKYTKNIRI